MDEPKHRFYRSLADLSGMPKGMSDCYKIGMGGGCGSDCPVFSAGECTEALEVEMAEKRRLESEESGLFYKMRRN